MPFLVDSVSAELTRRELPIHLVIHPICKVRRNKAGAVMDILERGHVEVDAKPESFMHFQIAQQPDKQLREIASDLKGILENVRASVEEDVAHAEARAREQAGRRALDARVIA